MAKTNIFKSTAIYFVGSVLSKIIVFFMLPIYTKYIPAVDMGIYDSAVAVVTFFSTVLFLDIGGGIMRFMYDKTDNVDKNYPLYSGLAIFLCSTTIFLAISLIVGFTVPFEYYLWIIVYGFLNCLHTVVSYISRGWGYSNRYVVSGIVNTVVTVVCNLIFLLVLRWDYKSLYISSCIGILVSIIVMETKNKTIITFKAKFFDKDLFIKILKFSLPLCLNSAAFWFLNSSNKVIISYMLGSDQTGYLAIANKFTSVIYLISTCFQLAWQELAFSKGDKNELGLGVFYSKAFDLFLRILLVGLCLLVPIIKLGLTISPSFIDASYSDSLILIPLALAGAVASIASQFLGSIFSGIKKNTIIFTSTISGAVVNLSLVFGLIALGVGVMSANIAFLCGFLTCVLTRTLLLRKYIGMKVKYWYVLVFVVPFAALCFVYEKLMWYYNLVALIIVCVLGIFVLRKELVIVFNALRKKLNKKKETTI